MKVLRRSEPNERWLMDLILVVHALDGAVGYSVPGPRQDSIEMCHRNMRTNFLNGSSGKRMAERIHFSR